MSSLLHRLELTATCKIATDCCKHLRIDFSLQFVDFTSKCAGLNLIKLFWLI